MLDLFSIFMVFFRIGIFTIGGGYAMLPLVEREVVKNRHWLEPVEFVDMLALAQSIPGAFIVNTAFFVGYRRRGVIGALAAVAGAVLPAFVVMLLIVMFFVGIKDNPTVGRIFKGIRPAVAAMIAGTLPGLAKKAGLTRKTILITIAGAIWGWLVPLSPAYIVLAAAAAGAIFLKADSDEPRPLNEKIQ